jgi:hypothetical protein
VQYTISSATLPDFSLNLTNFEMDLGAWTSTHPIVCVEL